MSNRQLKITVLVSIMLLLITCTLFFFKTRTDTVPLLGKLVFAKTYDKGLDIDYIVIKSAEGNVELKRKGSYWHVVNQADYYADFKLVYSLINSINMSTYALNLPYSQDLVRQKYLLSPLQDKENSGMLIQTYAAKQLLDEMIIGLPDNAKNYYFARKPDSEDIWLIDGNYSLPLKSENWIVTPILSIPTPSIESIVIDDVKASRTMPGEDFYIQDSTKANVAILLNVFDKLYATKVLNSKDFEQQYLKIKEQKNIEITTFYGLKFVVTQYLMTDNKLIFSIKLATTPLPNSNVNDYIKDNIFLFEGWYFEIYPKQEQILRYFNLV